MTMDFEARDIANLAFGKVTGLKGNTASRPTLGTGDIGQRYFDTTLATAGKPIWWTGSSWVDATGTIV